MCHHYKSSIFLSFNFASYTLLVLCDGTLNDTASFCSDGVILNLVTIKSLSQQRPRTPNASQNESKIYEAKQITLDLCHPEACLASGGCVISQRLSSRAACAVLSVQRHAIAHTTAGFKHFSFEKIRKLRFNGSVQCKNTSRVVCCAFTSSQQSGSVV